MPQWPWTQEATVAGGAAIMPREQIAYTTSVVLCPWRVRVRRICRTWAAPGNPTQSGAVAGLDGASDPATVGGAHGGDVGPGQSFEGPQPRLVVLHGQHLVAVAAGDVGGGLALTVQRVGGDDNARKVELGQQERQGGVSLLLAATASCPATTPVSWCSAASRWGMTPRLGVPPRRDLPSTAMTVCPARCPTRVAIHTATRRSRSSPSTAARVRRIVDSDGRLTSASIPKRVNVSRSVSGAHSLIASRVRAPAARLPERSRARSRGGGGPRADPAGQERWRTPRSAADGTGEGWGKMARRRGTPVSRVE